MTSRVTLTFRIPADGMILQDYELEALGGDLYRVMMVPWPFDDEYVGFRDVLRLERAPDGELDLVEVAERGGWKRFDFTIPKTFAESNELAAFVVRVEAAGGVWVRDFGGCLSILLPPNSIWDPTRELQAALIESVKRRATILPGTS